MDINQLLSKITPEEIDRLNYAVETGRGPEGQYLTEEQRDSAMQIVMLYQSRHNINAQHMTVGQGGMITVKSKKELKAVFSADSNIIAQFELNTKS